MSIRYKNGETRPIEPGEVLITMTFLVQGIEHEPTVRDIDDFLERVVYTETDRVIGKEIIDATYEAAEA